MAQHMGNVEPREHTGKVEGREANNIIVCGKRFYVPSDKVHLFEKYPAGSSVTLTEVKGTVTAITPLNGNAATGTAAPVKPAAKIEHTKTSPGPALGTAEQEFKRKFIDLLKNDPEVRAKIQEIREASS